MNKTHISLNVTHLGKAIAFYRNFLQAEPARVRPGYANFELDDPPLKLALNETTGDAGLSHLGVQVPSSEVVFAAAERFGSAGLESLTEEDTDCCHALQDKVWVSDPDGHAWEVFTVKGDASQPQATPCGCSC